MSTLLRLGTLATTTMLGLAPFAFAGQAQAAPPQPTPTTSAGAVSLTPGLDLTVIRALKSKDHTTAVNRVRIAPFLEPDATVWTSTKWSVTTTLAWNIRDTRDVAERVRICADDPDLRREQCSSYPLKATRGARGPVQVRALPNGWQVLVRPSYDARTKRECRSEHSRGALATWRISLIDTDSARVVGRSATSWRVRCGR